METQLDFYKSFHSNPINQNIHTLCIPAIVLCVLNYASLCKINIELTAGKPKTINTCLEDLINIIYCIQYYRYYGIKIGTVMLIYIQVLLFLTHMWRNTFENRWLSQTHKVFITAWVLQFLGHAIEGNRPSLMTSLTQTAFQAPLFTLEHIMPNLFQN
jgi:uncharacterized membrane protein YGL010W